MYIASVSADISNAKIALGIINNGIIRGYGFTINERSNGVSTDVVEYISELSPDAAIVF